MINNIASSEIGGIRKNWLIWWTLGNQDIKLKYLSESGIEQYVIGDGLQDAAAGSVINAFIDTLKDRIDKIKEKDTELKAYVKQEKNRKKRIVKVDSDLSSFLE